MPNQPPSPPNEPRGNSSYWNWYLSRRGRRRRRASAGDDGIVELADIPGLRFEFIADQYYLPMFDGLIVEWESTDFAIALDPETGDCTYEMFGLNGRPSVFINAGRLTGQMATLTGPAATFVFVGQFTDPWGQAGYARFLSMWDGVQAMDWNNPESMTIAQYTSGSHLGVVRNWNLDLAVPEFDPEQPVVAVVRRNGTSVSMLVKQPGLYLSRAGTTAAGNFSSDTFCIGGNNEDQNMIGYMCRVGCWARELTNAEAEAVVGYLANQYGIE